MIIITQKTNPPVSHLRKSDIMNRYFTCMKNKDLNSVGLLVLRLFIGGDFLYHGISKFGNLSGFFGFLEKISLPSTLGYVVPTVEVVGGILLILGLYSRISAGALGIVMAGAIIFAKLGKAPFELELFLLGGLIALFLAGTGSCGIGRKQTGKEEQKLSETA